MQKKKKRTSLISFPELLYPTVLFHCSQQCSVLHSWDRNVSSRWEFGPYLGDICVVLPKEGFFLGFYPENWGWTSWMEAFGKGGMFLYPWCKLQGEVELKMFSFSCFRQFLLEARKGNSSFSHLPFRAVCSKSSHFSMVMGKPGSNGTERNSQPAEGISFQALGNGKLGGKNSKSFFSTQRASQKNGSCFQI